MSTEQVTIRDDMAVELLDCFGTDSKVAQVARVSTRNEAATPERDARLVGTLVNEGHMVPLEHAAMTFRIECPIFVARQIQKHRMCLSGATRLNRRLPSGIRTDTNVTIAEIWEKWHVGSRTEHHYDRSVFYRPLPASKVVRLDCINEATGELLVGTVKDVIKTGVQETWLVKFANGKSIRSTKGHRYWTPDGWRQLGELKPGDLVAREGKVAVQPETFIPKQTRTGIQAWTTRQKRDRVVGMSECYVCHRMFPPSEIELDHVVPISVDITKALDVTNLATACIECHRSKTDTEQPHGARSRRGLRWEAITSISDPMEEETYDIEMDGEHHNFLAEGFVVHNSSQSELSGRYTEMNPEFYVPSEHRKLGQTGSRMAYDMVDLGPERTAGARYIIQEASEQAWRSYEDALRMGVAREVARMVLPLNVYTEIRMTMNLRSLLNFLSLRVDWKSLGYANVVQPSHPQWEVQEVALNMADALTGNFPAVWEAFKKKGFVA